MTEDQARQVLLVAACEGVPGSPHWRADDRAWATRQALAAVGEQVGPERFVTTRAALVLSRLASREPALARWAARRPITAGWSLLALLLGVLAGLLADQLGAPERVNLLAPAVWAVVAWNLAVYAAALLPRPAWSQAGLAAAFERVLAARSSRGSPLSGLGAAWLEHAAPLLRQRAALLMHLAAAGLAMGLAAGLYLRGLVMDYRAGWQSTFLDAGQVQFALDVLLGPAAWLTGITVPAVTPLQLAPGSVATASAAPWIHLYATTLLLVVLLPRLALAGVALLRALALRRRFPLPLVGAYFEGLHPLMRAGPARPLTLLWCPAEPAREMAPARLLGQTVQSADGESTTLLDCPEGAQLVLRTLPPALHNGLPPRPWWRFWAPPHAAWLALARLQAETDAVLLVLAPGATARPAWLEALPRPLILLEDAATAQPPALPLRALADGWLADGALWQALAQALPEDSRRVWLAAEWERRQAAQLESIAAVVADTLARLAWAQQPLAASRAAAWASSKHEEATLAAAREALGRQLEDELAALTQRLAALQGVAPAELEPAAGGGALALMQPKAPARLREGRAALWGGVLSGALAGLKADLATGGLTMGAGALTGGVIGALGAAGVARGVNVVRGHDGQALRWGADELGAITSAALKLPLALRGAEPQASAARLDGALRNEAERLSALWRERGPATAERLAPVLLRVLKGALGGP
jgi:hypothetical protein